MKLATMRDGTRDGTLLVVSRDLSRAVQTGPVVRSLWRALEHWDDVEPKLLSLYDGLNSGRIAGTLPFEPAKLAAPLPRASQWLDGPTFPNHSRLMARAFNRPHDIDRTRPSVYQGASDDFLGPCDDVPLPDEDQDIDFEGEFAVIVDDVPMGVTADQAANHVRLVTIVNDISLRALAPLETINPGFGLLQSKPSSSFAPVAVTPDELGEAWRDGRVHLPLRVEWNGQWFGNPNGGEMEVNFFQLIQHAARTRNLRAGTILGSGTVSNATRDVGSACICERRAIEMIDHGEPRTPFMSFGDRVRMESLDAQGRSVFGAIDQRIVPAPTPESAIAMPPSGDPDRRAGDRR